MPRQLISYLTSTTALTEDAAGIEAEAGEARVRLHALADGVFRVRFAPPGAAFDEPPFSYAVRADAPAAPDHPVTITRTTDEVRVQCGAYSGILARDPLRIRFEDADGHVFAADDFGIGWQDGLTWVWKRHVEGTHYYGLGEKTAPLDRTHRAFENWNTDFFGYQRLQDPIYKSLPFFIALQPCADGRRRAYGIFLDNSHRSRFDFAAEARRCVSFGTEGGEMRYYVCLGPSFADVLRRYTALTGRMPLPPRWALGYHQSRWSYHPEHEVRSLVRQFRDRRIPLDVLHLDIHYMDGYRIFTWDPERFPDPERLLRDLMHEGVKTIVIVDPGVKVDPGYAVYEEGRRREAFVTYPDGTPYTAPVWPGDCHFPDFTRPATRDWFGGYYRTFADTGVAGFWNDMNEPAVFEGNTAPALLVHDFEGLGGTHREAHNVYGLLMARAAYEALDARDPDARPFLITRAAFAGIQRYASVWTGDNVADWSHLQMVLPMLLSLGLSGVPFAGSDVGGFIGAPSPELYARWIQLGAFSPLFRTHSAYDAPRQEPWSYGPEVEAIARRYIELRYRLIPLFYTLFEEHARTGLPPLRPLVLHYPQDDAVLALDDQFLLGEALLVAPVLHPGRTARKVYLPAGRWYDFWTGAAFEGGRTVLVSAELDHLPIFVRAGTVLALAPVRQHVDEQPVEELELRLYPGTGTSALYRDDGRSQAYRQGDFRHTVFSMTEIDAQRLRVRCTHTGSYTGDLRRFRLVVPGRTLRPDRVRIDGVEAPEQNADTAEGQAEEPEGVRVPAHVGEITLGWD
ncbi:MAG: DUF5110 domain-containing protein [Bacteroidetes bacterium]|nr:MAG: DUF5110 domain-containing protein [Bacteroidota bacterium]